MTENEKLVDREREVADLRALLQQGAPRLALLTGRRRVGKTFLLTRTWPADQTFYFTAANTTPAQNRAALVAEVARWSNSELALEDYPTWRTVFRLLLDLRSPRPQVVVLDEFQYLGESEAALGSVASELNAIWEERRPARPFVLVLSGSAVRTMEALGAGAAPLHGRFHWTGVLRPFDYLDAGEMAGFRSLRDRALAWGIFGGLPRHLAAIRSSRPLAENVSDTFLDPRGEVRTQVETALLQEEGLRDVAGYYAVLRAIAGGSTTLSTIGQRAGLGVDTALRTRIERLRELGFVEAGRNLGASGREPYRYRLSDPAQMFHAEFIGPYETELSRHPAADVWRERVAPALDGYMGHLFERLVEQAYVRLRPRWKLPLVLEWGRWEGLDRDRKPVEVDLACRLSDGRVLSGAVKWNRRPLGAEVHTEHLESLRRLAYAGQAWAHAALERRAPLLYVAAGGFSAGFVRAVEKADQSITMWTLEDLYRRDSA